MSFLSRRSRSQRSFNRGGEEISVRRINPSNQLVKCPTDSDGSLPPNINATDFALYSSCVLRKFPKHKTSHLRFLAWVAYTRKFTDEPITEDERRTCPLLWCRTVFQDQDAMLQHVWDCEHLAKGLYWCFHCEKAEQVGSFECRRCQGNLSKVDRITTVAKRIFSKMGSKRHRAPPSPEPEPDMIIAKYAEKSNTLEHHPDYPTMFDTDPARDFQSRAFSGGGIVGTGAGWRASQELPDTQICEMIGSECPPQLGVEAEEHWLDRDEYTEPENIWLNPGPASKVPSPTQMSRGSLDMLPPLNTQLCNLNPERGFDNVSSNELPDEPMSATIISPMGAGDHYASILQEISPTDTDNSANTFLTDSGYTSATMFSALSTSSTPFELHPGFNEPRGKKRTRDVALAAHSMSNSVEVSRNNSAKSNRSFTNQAPKVIDAVDDSHSPSRCPSTKKPKMQSPHWSSAATLVQSFSEVLDAHISHTKDVIRQLPQSPLTTELLSMSRSSMVSIGLEVLAGIIEGRNPSAIVQVFAFAHVAYAFSIAIDHDEIKVHTQEWFDDALSWIEDLGSERDRLRYTKIAKAVWKPVEALREGAVTLPFLPDKQNRLYLACQRFLDILESFDILDSKSYTDQPPTTSDLVFSSQAQAKVIDELIKAPSIEAFIEDVVKVETRLKRGRIRHVRHLELELMCAGKLASQSESAYNRFLNYVVYHCNDLYESTPERSRAVCRIRDISRIKTLLPEEAYDEPDVDDDKDSQLDLDIDMPLGFDINILRKYDNRMRDNVNAFARDADEVLVSTHALARSTSTQPQSSLVSAPVRRSKSDQKRPAKPLYDCLVSTKLPHTSLSIFQDHPGFNTQDIPSIPSRFTPPTVTIESLSTSPDSSGSTSAPPTPQQEETTRSYQCDLCDYIPSGEQKWKPSNLRRHKRTQHASADKKGSWACQWDGCTKSFTRSDNLRSHMRDKGHEVVLPSNGQPLRVEDGGVEDHDSDEARLAGDSMTSSTAVHDPDERGSKRRKLAKS